MRNVAIAAATCWLVALPCVALADRVAGEEKADLCLLCHGALASEGKGYIPVLDGQPPAYFIAQLTAYQTGKRTDATMKTNAASLSAVDAQDIADFFASRKSGPYPVFDSERAGSQIHGFRASIHAFREEVTPPKRRWRCSENAYG